jgi:hypothetical protein
MAPIISQGALGVEEFLRAYPGMGLRPIRDNRVELEGIFAFSAESDKHGRVTDKFELKIDIPNTFPKELPLVYELQGRIPREDRYHVNPTDHSLCLGSPLRLLTILAGVPTLTGFAARCLIPYLYAVSLKLDRGGEFAFGELPHGRRGEIVDYGDLLGLGTVNQVMKTISYLGMKKRRANKLPCPCQCGRRLGVCALNSRIRRLRQLAERAWFRQLLLDLSRIDSSKAGFHSAVRSGLRV